MARTRLYETKVKPHLEQIKEMAMEGLSQGQIANALNINLRTFENYIQEEAELFDAVHSGRDFAIKEIENALFKSALGEKITVKKPIKIKKVLYENGKKKGEVEVVENSEEEIYIKPDTNAGIFLLKNWAKDKYANDPRMYDLKKREQELKEKMAEIEVDDEYNPFS